MVVVEDKNGNPYLVNQENIRFAHIVNYRELQDGSHVFCICVEIKFTYQALKEPGLFIEVKGIESCKEILEQLSGNLVVIKRENIDDVETPVMKSFGIGAR